jgi:hypothetical protein
MPTPKPSTLPRWSDVSGTKTAPSSGQKDSGFATNAVPTSGFLNWLFNNYYQWAQYLDAFLTDAHTWVGAQTFGTVNATSVTASAAITGATIAATGNATVGGTLTVTGDGFFDDDLTVTDLLTAGRALITGAFNAASLSAASVTATSGGVNVTGTGQFNNNINVEAGSVLGNASASHKTVLQNNGNTACLNFGGARDPFSSVDGDIWFGSDNNIKGSGSTWRLYINIGGTHYYLNFDGTHP